MAVTFITQNGFMPGDKTKPVILTEHVDLLYGTQLSSDMIEAFDSGSDELVISTGDFNPYEVGEQKVTVKATDENGNTASKEITANVLDMTAPEFMNLEDKGHVVAEVGGSTDISNYIKVNDNADGDISKLIKTDKKLDTSKPGKEKIKCSVSDMSGNKTEKVFTFDIVDTKAPKITLEDDNVEYGDDFKLSDHVSVKDNCDDPEDINLKSNDFDTKKYGKQKITVKATDKAGNTSEKEFTFNVTDSKAPVLKLADDRASITEGDDFDKKSMIESATDERDGDIDDKVVISGDVNNKKSGTYDLEYSVSDSAGNKVTKDVTVTVHPEYGSGIINTAMKKVGSSYVFGANGPTVFDCSGFAQWVYAQNGKSLPRSSSAQYAATARTSTPHKGDLVFFKNTYKPGISHVGIYLGNGMMVEAANKRLGVKVSSLSGSYYKRHFAGYGVVQ